jgi:predicted amidohydrolase YtcJ
MILSRSSRFPESCRQRDRRKFADTSCAILARTVIHWLQPLRSIVDPGAPLSFGSDYPVTSNNPFLAIETALTQMNATGKSNRTFDPSERIEIAEAIDGLARHAARQLDAG